MEKEKNLKELESLLENIRLNIVILMKENNIEIPPLAKSINIPEVQLYRIIFGLEEVEINVFILKRIADALNVKMEDLLYMEDCENQIPQGDILKILNEASLAAAEYELNNK